jgi:dihydroflavonol-4-reductase
MSAGVVAVTGASGYLGSLVVALLVRRGFHVRAAVRSLDKVPAQLRSVPHVTFVAVPDLLTDDGWAELMSGAQFVQHIASPVFVQLTKEQQIEQAVQGTTRALKFALAAGTVKRVVVTASMASVCGSQRDRDPTHLWSEADHNDAPGTAYSASKTAAEAAAWAFVKEHPTLELVTIHPGAAFSPLLPHQLPQSTMKMFVDALDGTEKQRGGLDFNSFGVVDGRDVARAHFLAMISAEAKNQRYLVSSRDQSSMLELVQIALKHFPGLSSTAATNSRDATKYSFTPRRPSTKIEKIEHLFDGHLLTMEQTVVDTVQNLVESGILKLNNNA